jgi:hypothetical protein
MEEVPILLSIVEGREFTMKVGEKTYWYLVDAAYKDAILYTYSKSPWRALGQLKKLCSDWREVIK